MQTKQRMGFLASIVTLQATRRFARRYAGPEASNRRRVLAAAGWWAATLIILPIYAVFRSYADDFGMPRHGDSIERTLFGGGLPTLWLQDLLWTNGSKTTEWAVVAVHSSWFFVPFLAAIFVTFRRMDRVGSLFRWWLGVELLAIPLFALFPVRPPWMENHEVVRIVALRFGGQIDDSNALAAMPSLHVAFPFVIALWFQRERWTLPARAMFAYTAVVAFEVVFSGEHYVMDAAGAVAFGFAIAALSKVDAASAARDVLARTARLGKRLGDRLVPAHGESGQALIELAFVLPVMLVFLLVLVDFGLALDRREVLQHAAREGARYGAVHPGISNVIETTANQSVDVINFGDLSVDTTTGCGTKGGADPGKDDSICVCYEDGPNGEVAGNPGSYVRVSIGYTYGFTAGSGELLSAFGLGTPKIEMSPIGEAVLEQPVAGANPCDA